MWDQMYVTAKANLNAAAGFYNDNVRVETDNHAVNVRIPIAGASIMDLRLWPEDEVLASIAPHVTHVPQLLHVSADPAYQVHEFIDGAILNDVAPRGEPLPSPVIASVVQLLAELAEVPLSDLPHLPDDWPSGSNTVGFALRLSDLTQWVYDIHVDEYEWLYRTLGVPADPVAPAVHSWPSLAERPLVLVHADIHRKNMIVRDGSTYFLDWELALFGDPVYDLSVHLHKMAYLRDERETLQQLWSTRLPASHTAGWERDVNVYLAHEQIKSAIVDSVRYAQVFCGESKAQEAESDLVGKLAAKLNAAYTHWDVVNPIDQATVEATLRHWQAQRRST